MRGRKRTAVLLLVALLAGAISSADDKIAVEATGNPSKTQQEIKDKENEKNQLTGQLDEEKDKIGSLQGERNTLQGHLNNLNSQMTEVSDRLAVLEQQIKDKEQDILETQAALEEAREIEALQYNSMVIRARETYERNDAGVVSAILNAGSFAEMVNAADYFQSIAAYEQRKLDEFMENRRLIEEQEVRLKSDRAELENMRVEVEAEQSRVSGLINQTSSSIAWHASEISEAERRAREYEEQIRKADEDLDALRKKLAEELALSRQAANSVWRDISEVSFAEGDRKLLANLIYCEAGGEPYEGQVAVGSVVINRVLSSVFPDTVVGVIYQNRQFSPVASGRLALALEEDRATARCYQAADEAMSGYTNVGQCLFFRTPIDGLTGINIGGHVFY